MEDSSGSVLNPHQQRHLRVTLHEADRLLSEVEQVLSSTDSKSPFPKHIVDLTPAQRKTIEDYISRIRTRLIRVLEGQNIELEPPFVPATRAIHSALTFIEVAVEELKPRYMRGYGEVPPAAIAELNGIVGELSVLVQQLDRYVTQSGQDLQQRLIQLERAEADVEPLKELELTSSKTNITTAHASDAQPQLDSNDLQRLADLAESFGAERVVNDARALAERIAEGRFYVACVGQFKRGKSTLLNALVGEAVLPTGVVPVTTVPTVLRYGQPSARVQTANRSWTSIQLSEVEQYVSEEHNPENAKGVTGVEVFVPAPLLGSGMCFVDTPGLGSVFAGNTAATQDFIPHIDAALVVVGADPPISGEELAIVETVAKQVSDLLFVLNKADRVTERERSAAIKFARKLLESRLRRSGRKYLRDQRSGAMGKPGAGAGLAKAD